MPTIAASVARIHDTRQYMAGDAAGYGSGDPSGLAYVPGLNTLFIADSEHDESPYHSLTNLFGVRPDGSFVRSFSLTGFTSEPAGLGYNPVDGFLYIADDDKQEVFWVDPADPSRKIGQFDTSRLGLTDTEDPKFDPVSGHMFLLDGTARTLFELTAQGAFAGAMPLPSVMTDAEALAYDPAHDLFFVASGSNPTIWQVSRSGALLATIDVLAAASYLNPVTGAAPAPKGLELAPSSNPTDGNTMSLFAADYGVDQHNDGRLFEISLGPAWLVGGPGDDRLDGGSERDVFHGFGGSDLLLGYGGDDVLDGGDGNDGLRGHAGNDLLLGGRGHDRMDGGPGSDTLLALSGRDTLFGRDGHDRLYGGTGPDHLDGGSGDDLLNGRASRDRLDGGSGHDALFGHRGSDVLLGRNGNDRLEGGPGNDLMLGGRGVDAFVFRRGFGHDIIAGFGDTPGDQDTLRLHGLFRTKAEVVAASSQEGENVVIRIGTAYSITLKHFSLAAFGSDDFRI